MSQDLSNANMTAMQNTKAFRDMEWGAKVDAALIELEASTAPIAAETHEQLSTEASTTPDSMHISNTHVNMSQDLSDDKMTAMQDIQVYLDKDEWAAAVDEALTELEASTVPNSTETYKQLSTEASTTPHSTETHHGFSAETSTALYSTEKHQKLSVDSTAQYSTETHHQLPAKSSTTPYSVKTHQQVSAGSSTALYPLPTINYFTEKEARMEAARQRNKAKAALAKNLEKQRQREAREERQEEEPKVKKYAKRLTPEEAAAVEEEKAKETVVSINNQVAGSLKRKYAWAS